MTEGLWRGVLGAMAMTGVRVLWTEVGLLHRPPPPQQMSREGGLLAKWVPNEKVRAAEEIAHWGYGALGGAMFDVLPYPVRRLRWTGPLFGLALWLGFETVLAPVLGLSQEEAEPHERAVLAADHVLYGAVLGFRR